MGYRGKPPSNTPRPDITPAPQPTTRLGEGFPPPQHQTEGWKPIRESPKATREELVEVLRTTLKRAVVQEELDYELRRRIRDILKREP